MLQSWRWWALACIKSPITLIGAKRSLNLQEKGLNLSKPRSILYLSREVKVMRLPFFLFVSLFSIWQQTPWGGEVSWGFFLPVYVVFGIVLLLVASTSHGFVVKALNKKACALAWSNNLFVWDDWLSEQIKFFSRFRLIQNNGSTK